uniref:Uncharacterized protein n=1 Tax=Aliivibrio fischeri TaxID=668 RepID=H2ERS8_ALIFS|nr:hypothetical protein [Aliivibrio fischeri]
MQSGAMASAKSTNSVLIAVTFIGFLLDLVVAVSVAFGRSAQS